MQKIIRWIKSLFKSENNEDLFSNQPPRDDYEYQDLLAKREIELDRILNKIQKHGIESLSFEEKSFLKKMKK